MTSISWSWQDWWAWFSQIENEGDKLLAWQELLGNGWMKNLAPNIQAEVFRYAPLEILESLKHFPDVFKRATLIILDREINGTNRYRR